MFSTVLSSCLQGLEAKLIQVEADVSNGLPMFHLVGYLSSEVKEAGERVRTAIRNSGYNIPAKKIVINLSPANMRKKGTIFDLPIAVSVLASMEQLPQDSLKDTLLVGELSLDGSVKKVSGILSVVLKAKEVGCKRCIVPRENQKEGELIDGIDVIGVSDLEEACSILKGETAYKERCGKTSPEYHQEAYADFSEVKGQPIVKRAAEIAVSGNHNLLMIGAYGAGKTAIAKRIPGILPPLSLEESIELTMVYSVIGQLDSEKPLKRERPFREVNPTITQSALLGGGIYPRPGEISLAHKGVLFLDEVAEFPRSVLESLRQPLEEHEIRITREKGDFYYPADFLLVAAMNPCPCGNYPDLNRCTCTTSQIQSYSGKLSQPLMDRIDLCVEVPKVQYTDLADSTCEESSEHIRERVMRARAIQSERYASFGIRTNSQLNIRQIEEFCLLNKSGKDIMHQAYERMGLSARMYHKVLCVARTIADLDEKKQIEEKHLREALSYRIMKFHDWRK